MTEDIELVLLNIIKRSSRLSECFALVNFNTFILLQKTINVNSLAFTIHKNNTLNAMSSF